MLARPTGILMSEQHLKPGDQAPNVTLLTKDGKSVQIANFWAEGPTLLVFLRHFG
jgi:peroxiredoxin